MKPGKKGIALSKEQVCVLSLFISSYLFPPITFTFPSLLDLSLFQAMAEAVICNILTRSQWEALKANMHAIDASLRKASKA
jgi:hypothetical protein